MNYGTPILLDGLTHSDPASPMLPVDGARAAQVKYSERLLQTLVHRFPQCLPVYEVEPAFNDLRSVCMELPLGWEGQTVYADNLLVNPDGKLCLVECKLWRNGESSREVVAQIINYAAALASLTYDELSARVGKALRSGGVGDALSWAALGDIEDADAIGRFMRGVERNLRTGSFLLLIVGDRIQPGISRMTDLLQLRPTIGFAIGLVEMPVYATGAAGNQFVVQPRLIARTETVIRTVFLGRAADGSVKVADVEPAGTPPGSLSETEFYQALSSAQPALESGLRDLLQRCVEEHGCRVRLLRRFNIYVEDRRGGEIPIATIGKDGTVEFWGNSTKDKFLGRPVIQAYLDRVATFLPSARSRDDAGVSLPNVRVNGKTAIPLSLVLQHQSAWFDALDKLRVDIEEAASSSNSGV